MTNDNEKKGFAKWLETLQQESWQLELIISGFAIFLLIGTLEFLEDWNYNINQILAISKDRSAQFLKVGFLLAFVIWHVLFINLIIHVLLRGLWISTIGLRYVSGDIDFVTLNFSSKFDQFLRKKIISFDHYIEQLEKICSVIFSFTFLIVFISLSVGIFILLFLAGIFSVEYFDQTPNSILALVLLGLVILLFFGSLIYLLDFLTLGWLKRQEKISKFYFPIYRFYSYFSLAFIYRPLYYNLIDHKFGRWVGVLSIPYLIVLFTTFLVTIESYSYLPRFRKAQTLRTKYYDDIRPAKRADTRASIPSKYIKNGFIELYIPYVPKVHDLALAEICPEIHAAPTGISFDFFISTKDAPRGNINADSALVCISNLHQIYIDDSLRNDVRYHFYEHPQREDIGLLTILDVDYLSRGEHRLSIKSKYKYHQNEKGDLDFRQTDVIPFWKE